MILTMPWPPTGLSPNARLHFMAVYREKARYREACAWTAKSQGARRIEADRLDVALTFYPPSRRRIDIDNCLARFKSGIDGLVDVLGVDDSKWRITLQKAEEIGGFVRVEVRL